MMFSTGTESNMWLVKNMYAGEDGTHTMEWVDGSKLPEKLVRAAKILNDKEWRFEIQYYSADMDWSLEILWWGGMGWYNVAWCYFNKDGKTEAHRRTKPFNANSAWYPIDFPNFMKIYVHDNKGKDQ